MTGRDALTIYCVTVPIVAVFWAAFISEYPEIADGVVTYPHVKSAVRTAITAGLCELLVIVVILTT